MRMTKESQGEKKILELLENLFKNKDFVKRVKKDYYKTSNFKTKDKNYIQFAKDYGLDLSFVAWYLAQYLDQEKFDIPEADITFTEMCKINSDIDKVLHPEYYKSAENEVNSIIYPISIGISSRASQTDVVDFIKKKWPSIQTALNTFQSKEFPKIKTSPKRIRNNFIWKNRNLPIDKQVDLVNEKFPNETIGYDTVYATINLEKKRRGIKK